MTKDKYKRMKKYLWLFAILYMITYPYSSVVLEFNKYRTKHKTELIDYLGIPSKHITNVLSYRFQARDTDNIDFCYIDYFYISEDITNKITQAVSDVPRSYSLGKLKTEIKDPHPNKPYDCLQPISIDDLTPVWKAPYFHHVDKARILVMGNTDNIDLVKLSIAGENIILLYPSPSNYYRTQRDFYNSGYLLMFYKDKNLIKVASHAWKNAGWW